jgi:uncharacterized membrane protein
MNDKPRLQFLTTTLIGGLLFLVPVVFLAFILGKAFGFMLVVAKPMATWIPIDRVGGVAIANLIALLAIILLCFLAGLLARSALASGLVRHLEEKILMKIPGYALVRGLKSSIDNSDEAKLRPVLVDLGYCQRLGFQSEQLPDGRCVVYLPGSPNTWSGITLVAAAEQVEYLDVPLKEMIDLFEGYGYGTAEVLAPGLGSEHIEASERID